MAWRLQKLGNGRGVWVATPCLITFLTPPLPSVSDHTSVTSKTERERERRIKGENVFVHVGVCVRERDEREKRKGENVFVHVGVCVRERDEREKNKK